MDTKVFQLFYIIGENMFTAKEREALIKLICNEQIHMIIKHPERYDTDDYKVLEELKVKIKDDIEESEG